ncbi:MAG TPA: NAD(P)H-binding protein [Chitinophagales bacterium]|nr:NAD(P)H-binding protein [Chitinophagales bacterium]
MINEVFITGGTGYIGSRLVSVLMKKNFPVSALVRNSSEEKLPEKVNVVFGNALDASTFADKIPPSKIFIHMIGVAHPGPRKKQQFIDVDLKSIQQSVTAAKDKGIEHFIYISVAPSDIMKDYSDVRMQGEKLIYESFSRATFIRPFYVLGPAHYWPLLLTPLFKILSLSKSGREKAKRLGLVWIGQMVNALVWAVENPAHGIRILEVKDIKKFPKKY